MGKASRDKGKRGEREVAKLWDEAMPGSVVRRGGQDQAHTGDKSGDVIAPGWRIEVKRYARVTRGVLVNALAQAENDARANEIPVAVARGDRSAWVCAIRLHELVEVACETSGAVPGANPIVELPLGELLKIIRSGHD